MIEFRLGHDPTPAYRRQLVGVALQLLTRKAIEKFGIGKEAAAFGIEQVADDDAARCLIGLGTDEHRAAVVRAHLPFAQGAKDCLAATVEGR